MIDKTAPFPQANDFEKVISIVNIDDPSKLKDTPYMCVYLGDITARQVDYYISACRYLGLVKNKEFTELGLRLRNKFGVEQTAEFCRILVSDESIGTAYFQQKILGVDLDIDYVVDIMKETVVLNGEPMYRRRGSTILQWVKWMNEQEFH